MAVKRQVVMGVASLAALYVGVSNALGLGELRLDSSLNQPLSATIAIQGGEGVSPSDVIVTLANQEAFEQAGIDRPFFLSDLRFTPVVENNRLSIRVESSKPVREPYLNFLVELRRPSGRLLREYTLLLDPPLYDPAAVVGAPVSPARQASSSRAPAASGPARETPSRQAPQPLQLPDIQPQAGARTHYTVAGDTLWVIAENARPADSVSVRDTMLAIRALNPGAFIEGDINRLRLGQDLTLPTAEQLGGEPGVSSRAQPPRTNASTRDAADTAADERASRQQQADASNSPRQNGAAGQLRIEEPTPSAAEKQNAVLIGRLQELESKFNVLLSELDSRDRQIASLQAEVEELRRAQENSDTTSAAAIATGSVQGADGGPGAISPGGSDAPEPGALEAEVLPEENQTTAASFFAQWWPALLALAAFLLGLIVSRLRGRSDESETPEEPVEPVLENEHEEPNLGLRAGSSLIGAAPAHVPVPAPRLKPQPTRQDPLDGVELYLTYGRFTEARVMLDKAIAEEPGRLDLRYKQLRVLAELDDADAFEDQQAEILEAGGDPDRVEQIRSRFPNLFDQQRHGLVDRVEEVEPFFDDEPEQAYQPAMLNPEDMVDSQLNLNDFSLDPDWDLIEGLSPAPRKPDVEEAPEPVEEELDFESSLHELPEVEELDHDDHDNHFAPGTEEEKTRNR